MYVGRWEGWGESPTMELKHSLESPWSAWNTVLSSKASQGDSWPQRPHHNSQGRHSPQWEGQGEKTGLQLELPKAHCPCTNSHGDKQKIKWPKKKKLRFKVEPFRCQKTGWHYYCLLVFSFEIKESIPLANTGTGPSKMFSFNQIMGVSTNWGFAHGCLFGCGAERDLFWSAVTTVGTLVSALYAWLRRKKLKKEPGKLVTSAI